MSASVPAQECESDKVSRIYGIFKPRAFHSAQRALLTPTRSIRAVREGIRGRGQRSVLRRRENAY